MPPSRKPLTTFREDKPIRLRNARKTSHERAHLQEDFKVPPPRKMGDQKQAEAWTLNAFRVLAVSGFSLLQCHSTTLKFSWAHLK